MRKNKNDDRLDSDCNDELSCQRLYDSPLDPINIQNSESDSETNKLNLQKLEYFVNEVLLNNEMPFMPYFGTNGKEEYVQSSLAQQYFKCLPDFIDVVNRLPPKYEYSEAINAFINCCDLMGLLGERLEWRYISTTSKKNCPCWRGVPAAELFNRLVHNIQTEWKLKNLQAKVNTRKQEVANQKDEYCKYADSLLDDGYARLVVLRIDLFYEKQYADSIDIFDMTKDLDRLFENARHNSLFAFMKGYIVKLEYGVDKGLHAHVILFFDGSKRNNLGHIYLAEKIGKYWKNMITKGRGAYWNANAKGDSFDELGKRGIGVINWNDTDLRNNLRELVVSYLCKEDQYFRSKVGPKVRLLRRGDFPEKPVTRLGRPRKELESYTGLSQSPQNLCQ